MREFEAARYVSVRTYKRSGDPVDTPVWPVIVDGRLLFGTPSHTHKVGRIRRNPRVAVAACDSRGELLSDWSHGTARLLDRDEFDPYRRLIDARQRFASIVVRLWSTVKGWDHIGVEVVPADDP